MKRIVLIALLLVLALPMLAAAQDSTEEATPPTVPTVEVTPVPEPPAPENPTATYWIFTAVIFGLLGVIALVLRPAIVQLGASAPKWAVDAAYNAAITLIQEGERRAGESPSKIDDELIAELRRELEKIRGEIAATNQVIKAAGL